MRRIALEFRCHKPFLHQRTECGYVERARPIVRLVFVFEDAPEFAGNLPEEEWAVERDAGRIAQMLNDSAKAVRDAVKSRVETGLDMNLHYDHPILLLQHMLWHEGYHHGQMKLALKMAGRPMTDDEAGPVTWDVWMRKK